MIVFWILAAAVSSLAAVLILVRAAGAERDAPAGDPVLGVYRRQLDEIEDLADRGLLGPDEHRSARAEAARRLIVESDRPGDAAPAAPKRAQRIVLAAAVLAPAAALAVYLALGSPGLPDQPFKQRLQAWRADPAKLDPERMTAVMEQVVAEHPRDPQALVYLAVAQSAAGDPPAAERTLEKAAALKPDDVRVWTALGRVRMALGKDQVTPDAEVAFARAHALDPAAPAPRYFLAHADIAAGRTQAGLEQLRSLAITLPAGGPDRAALEAEIAYVARTGRLPDAQVDGAAAAAQGGDQAAFIQSMVDRLAGRLKAQPDDPAGWARLIRAYGVLGQTDRQGAAIAEVRRRFAGRPDALRTALADQGPSPP